jgi:hypothetical protein
MLRPRSNGGLPNVMIEKGPSIRRRLATGQKKFKKTGKKHRASDGPGSRKTEPNSRIMPTCCGGFEQVYSAQASMKASTKLNVFANITPQANDKQQLKPRLKELGGLP